VKLIVTSNDVIHAFGVPAFWVKMDAVPGRLNETWFKSTSRASITANATSCAARATPTCRSRSRWSAGAVRRLGRSKGGTMPGAPGRSRPRPTRRRSARSPSAGGTGPNTAGGSDRRRRAPNRRTSRHDHRPPVSRPQGTDEFQKRRNPVMTDTTANAVHFEAAITRMTRISRASSPAGSCRPTTRTSARST
jgi:hypothetical protein